MDFYGFPNIGKLVGKVSELWKSDGSGVALTADALGNLSGVGNNTLAVGKDVFPDGDTIGLAMRTIYNDCPAVTSLTSLFDTFKSGLSSGWTGWAGSPFVTPNLTYSRKLKASFSSAPSRSFLYRTGGLTTTTTRTVKLALNTNSVGAFIGHRLDDGTDTNYIEAVLTYYATNQLAWMTRVRTGGNQPAETVQKLIEMPQWVIVSMWHYGTLWSNWNAMSYLYDGGPGSYIASFITGLTWTASREGIVINHPSGSGTWQAYYAGWYM